MTDVLVIGAGPTGLAMGCQLARHGVSFRIIDDRAGRVHESRAIGVQARTMEVFDDLGLASAFLAQARRADPVRMLIHGRDSAALHFDELGDDTRFRGLYLVPQPQTERILRDHLRERGVDVEQRVRLLELRQDVDGVTAELERIADGVRETVRARYLVGCDGAHSRVRELLEIPFEGATYEEEFLLADVRTREPVDSLSLYLGRRALALVAPVGDLVRVMGYRFDHPRRDDAPTAAEVDDLLRDAQAPVVFSRVEWLTRFRLHHRATRHYRRGRAFLAGDACHIHSPAGGQGMNTGIQDATNLAWKLAAVLRGAPDALLDTYESERQRVGAKLVRTTDRAFGLIASPRRELRWVRDFIAPWLVPVAFRWKPMRWRLERFVSQLDIRYRDSAIVRSDLSGADAAFRNGLAEGCRIPDLPIGDTTLQVLARSRGMHALALGPCDEAGLVALERRGIDVRRLALADDTRELFRRFGVTQAAIYVIRPDGYIGLRSYGPSAASALAYLDAVLGPVPQPAPEAQPPDWTVHPGA
jgi:2-polyprenyl-6-methoxyphenol hydroxylase-like FAD-dependent oxidoreductase